MANKNVFELPYAYEVDGREVLPLEEEWTAKISLDDETLRLIAKAINHKPTGRMKDLPKKYFKMLLDSAYDAVGEVCCENEIIVNPMVEQRLMLEEKLPDGLVALLPDDVQAKLKQNAPVEGTFVVDCTSGSPKFETEETKTVEPERDEPEEREPGLDYVRSKNIYKIVGKDEPNKENTLYLTIKQVYFDEIIAGTKTIEYREIKETTYKKFLECDAQNFPMINTDLMSEDDPLFDDLNVWNKGKYPFVPKIKLRYLDLAVGYNKERDTALVELDGFSFSPVKLRDGSDARFKVIDNNVVVDPNGEYCLWVIELHIKRVLECHRH